ncbi:MAG: TatD family hydrolase [Candidatus Thorarchaeota archaeon]|jgi:TatD DNase family protein
MNSSVAMQIIDSHSHLENDAFLGDRDAVIKRAADEGIHIITSAIDRELWSRGLKIAEQHDNVYASLGLDPTSYGDCDIAIEWIRANHSTMIAIGEVGLDHFRIRNHSERNDQEQTFRKLIALASDFKLPIQVHSRSAGAKAIAVLEKCDARSVHMHAFDGKAGHAKKASRDLEYYFSIPISVVRSPQKRKLVKAVAIERLLMETDSPVLGPEKGIRNEPSNIWLALRETARILKREEEELREIVLENTLRLYSRIQPQ